MRTELKNDDLFLSYPQPIRKYNKNDAIIEIPNLTNILIENHSVHGCSNKINELLTTRQRKKCN